jgi:hypothetical protein
MTTDVVPELNDQVAWNRLSWEHNEGCIWFVTKALQICPFCDELWHKCKGGEFITLQSGEKWSACKRIRFAGKNCADFSDEEDENANPFEGMEIPEVHP